MCSVTEDHMILTPQGGDSPPREGDLGTVTMGGRTEGPQS